MNIDHDEEGVSLDLSLEEAEELASVIFRRSANKRSDLEWHLLDLLWPIVAHRPGITALRSTTSRERTCVTK